MTWVRTSVLLAALAVAGRASAAEEPAPTPVTLLGKVIGEENARKRFRHTATYPRLELAWQQDGRVGRALAVFPHPLLADRVLVATTTGLVLSDDAGATWTPLPQAASDRVGTVRHVALSLEAPDTFFLASASKGVWATTDAGKTLRQLGSQAGGLASDETSAVYLYPGDRRLQTLLAVHGGAAPGISITRDLGRTWRVVARDYYVQWLLCGNPGDVALFAVAARKSAPDVVSIHHAASVDDYWVELVKDVVPTSAAVSVLFSVEKWSEGVFHGAQPHFTTADGGLLRVSGTGGHPVGPPTLARAASVGVTWGPHADSQAIYVYEPRRLGLLVSTDEMQTVRSAGAGLYTGAFVKEGAHVRANANGSVFYGVVNDRLYVGRRRTGPLAVADARAEPAVITFRKTAYKEAMERLREALQGFNRARSAAQAARQLVARVREARSYMTSDSLTVTAKVTSAKGAPASVTVDLNRLGASALTALFDDGRHGDGAAGDGRYGAVVRLDPRRFVIDSGDRRGPTLGRVGLTVTAMGADKTLDGQVALVAVLDRRESFDVTNAYEPIAVKGEPWSVSYGPWIETYDIAGYYGLAFRIRTDTAGGGEVCVQLGDRPAYSLAVTTPPVPIVKEGLVAGGKITDEWRQVVIPLGRLLTGATGFRTNQWAAVILSGDGKPPGTYWVEAMRFLTSAEEARPAEGADSR